MDTSRFELTPDELTELHGCVATDRDKEVSKAQVAKVLSMIEPPKLAWLEYCKWCGSRHMVKVPVKELNE